MKKISYLAFLISVFIIVSDCAGYKPIFASKNVKFKISAYEIEGDSNLGNKLYSKLYNLSKSEKNNLNAKSLDLLINITKTKNTTLKDSSGKILEYKMNLDTKIKIVDFVSGKILLDQDFYSSLNYKKQDQYSDTIKLENQIIENLINNTYQEILINLSKNIS